METTKAYNPEEWDGFEQLELDSWEFRTLDIVNHLRSIRYELEHNVTPYDWCRIYSKAILDQDLDMTNVMRQFHIETEGKEREFLEELEYLPTKEWKEIAEYAKFVADLGQGLSNLGTEPMVNLVEFMGKSGDQVTSAAS